MNGDCEALTPLTAFDQQFTIGETNHTHPDIPPQIFSDIRLKLYLAQEQEVPPWKALCGAIDWPKEDDELEPEKEEIQKHQLVVVQEIDFALRKEIGYRKYADGSKWKDRISKLEKDDFRRLFMILGIVGNEWRMKNAFIAANCTGLSHAIFKDPRFTKDGRETDSGMIWRNFLLFMDAILTPLKAARELATDVVPLKIVADIKDRLLVCEEAGIPEWHALCDLITLPIPDKTAEPEAYQCHVHTLSACQIIASSLREEILKNEAADGLIWENRIACLDAPAFHKLFVILGFSEKDWKVRSRLDRAGFMQLRRAILKDDRFTKNGQETKVSIVWENFIQFMGESIFVPVTPLAAFDALDLDSTFPDLVDDMRGYLTGCERHGVSAWKGICQMIELPASNSSLSSEESFRLCTTQTLAKNLLKKIDKKKTADGLSWRERIEHLDANDFRRLFYIFGIPEEKWRQRNGYRDSQSGIPSAIFADPRFTKDGRETDSGMIWRNFLLFMGVIVTPLKVIETLAVDTVPPKVMTDIKDELAISKKADVPDWRALCDLITFPIPDKTTNPDAYQNHVNRLTVCQEIAVPLKEKIGHLTYADGLPWTKRIASLGPKHFRSLFLILQFSAREWLVQEHFDKKNLTDLKAAIWKDDRFTKNGQETDRGNIWQNFLIFMSADEALKPSVAISSLTVPDTPEDILLAVKRELDTAERQHTPSWSALCGLIIYPEPDAIKDPDGYRHYQQRVAICRGIAIALIEPIFYKKYADGLSWPERIENFSPIEFCKLFTILGFNGDEWTIQKRFGDRGLQLLNYAILQDCRFNDNGQISDNKLIWLNFLSFMEKNPLTVQEALQTLPFNHEESSVVPTLQAELTTFEEQGIPMWNALCRLSDSSFSLKEAICIDGGQNNVGRLLVCRTVAKALIREVSPMKYADGLSWRKRTQYFSPDEFRQLFIILDISSHIENERSNVLIENDFSGLRESIIQNSRFRQEARTETWQAFLAFMDGTYHPTFFTPQEDWTQQDARNILQQEVERLRSTGELSLVTGDLTVPVTQAELEVLFTPRYERSNLVVRKVCAYAHGLATNSE